MAESDSVRGYTGPVNPKEPEKERVAHPEEFKKILKVDESEESQKRRQRQLKKEESEGDDEDISAEPPPPSVETTFSEHMSDKKKLDGLYDTQTPSTTGPTKAPTSSPLLPSMDESAPNEDVDINEESSYVPPETTTSLPQTPQSQEPAQPEAPQEENVPSPTNPQSPETSTNSSQAQQPSQTPSKAKKVKDTSLLKDQPLKGALKKKSTTKKDLSTNKSSTKTSTDQTAKSPDTTKVQPEKSSTVEANLAPTDATSKENALQKKDKDSPDQITTPNSASLQDIPQAAQIEPTLAAPPTDLPTYTQLSTPVYELFEKMVGHIMIVNEKGVDSKTEVTLSMSGSVFDHSKIILDKQGSSFNIQFQGSDKANQLFGKNIQDLERCLQENQPNFSYNVLKPVLLPNLRATRKKKATPKAATKVRKKT